MCNWQRGCEHQDNTVSDALWSTKTLYTALWSPFVTIIFGGRRVDNSTFYRWEILDLERYCDLLSANYVWQIWAWAHVLGFPVCGIFCFLGGWRRARASWAFKQMCVCWSHGRCNVAGSLWFSTHSNTESITLADSVLVSATGDVCRRDTYPSEKQLNCRRFLVLMRLC